MNRPVSTDAETIDIRRPTVFGDRVIAGFSTRRGGRSQADFASLNLGLSTGDDEQSVRANRDIVFGSIGKTGRDLAVAGQTHGVNVSVVKDPGLYPDTDSLITAVPGQPLAITVADCAAVLMAEETAGVVAVCHAGWRGVAGRICSATIERMIALGARADRIRIYVSPCISVDRFEVGEEVASLFDERHVVRKSSWPRPHVDLKSAIVDEVISCGIAGDRVEVSAECTYDAEEFYSYRASAGRTGRMMGFIMLAK